MKTLLLTLSLIFSISGFAVELRDLDAGDFLIGQDTKTKERCDLQVLNKEVMKDKQTTLSLRLTIGNTVYQDFTVTNGKIFRDTFNGVVFSKYDSVAVAMVTRKANFKNSNLVLSDSRVFGFERSDEIIVTRCKDLQ